mgnify:FL=1
MIFITTAEADSILGSAWTTVDKKDNAVFMANVWLSAKKFCRGLDPIDEAIKQAGAYAAKLASTGKLYETQTDGTVTEKTVKADTVQVTKKYADGSETGKSADMKLIDDLLKPFLWGGGGSTKGGVCK